MTATAASMSASTAEWGGTEAPRCRARHSSCPLVSGPLLALWFLLAAAVPALAEGPAGDRLALPAAATSPVAAGGAAPAATPNMPAGSLAPAGAPAPGPGGDAAAPADGGFRRLLADPRAWVADVFLHALATLLRSIADLAHQAVGAVMVSPLNFITQTPPAVSYESATVRTLWGIVRAIANAGLVLVVAWGGLNLITRGQLGAASHEIKELLPRLAIAALLINTSLWWG
ncbi:MAG: hypothetical protein ACRDJN_26015, partial [Chloroflexota bacterium]